jgi:hypothetical protein
MRAKVKMPTYCIDAALIGVGIAMSWENKDIAIPHFRATLGWQCPMHAMPQPQSANANFCTKGKFGVTHSTK